MKNSPLYIEIAMKLKENIQNNYYEKVGMLPTETELTKEFNASRVTIRKAIDILLEEGLVYKKQGSGTYIQKKGVVNYNLHTLKGFKEEMEELGYEYRNEILEFSIILPENFIQQKLNLSSLDKVYLIKRLKYINNKPAVYEESYLPLKLFPDLTYEHMINSKYNYIEKIKKYKLGYSDSEIYPIIPKISIKEALNITEEIPILKTISIDYLHDDTPCDFSLIYFNPKNYTFKVRSNRI